MSAVREAIVLAIGYLLLVWQTTIGPAVAVGRAFPDLLTLVLVFASIYGTGEYAFLVGWALGLGRDLTASGPLGPYAFSYAAVAYLLMRIRHDLYREHRITMMVTVFVATSAVNAMGALVAGLLEGQGVGMLDGTTAALGTGLYTALLWPPGFWVLRRLRRLLGMVERFQIG